MMKGDDPRMGVKIEGVLYHSNWSKGEVLELDDFTNAFIAWVEAQGWEFGGGTSAVDLEGERVFAGPDR